jgi:hypothetical protein
VSEGSDAVDPALGWAYVEALLLEDEVARLDGLDEKELDGELGTVGIDPARVPSTETLLAKVEERAKKGGHAPARRVEPALGWAYVEGLLAEEDFERLETLDDEALDDELRRVGLDPARVPNAEALREKADARAAAKRVDPARGWAYVEKLIAKDEPRPVPSAEDLLAKATAKAKAKQAEATPHEEGGGGGGAEPGPAREPLSTRWRRRAAALAVAAAAAGGMVYAVSNQLPVVGEAQHASTIRNEAFAACQKHDWATCESKLNEARDIDPSGEDLPEVRDARAMLARAEQ